MSLRTKARFKSLVFWGLLAALPACDEFRSCRSIHSPLAVDAHPAITLQPSTSITKLVPGSAVQVSLVAQFVGGPTRANLSLGGILPAGVTALFSPTSVTESSTSTMTLVADSLALPILFVYDLVATEAGAATPVVSRAAMTGEVEVPFFLTTSGSQVVTVGTTRDVTIGVSRKPSFVAPVGLSVIPTTVPAGTTVSFAPPTVTGANATLQLRIPATADTGRYLVRTVGRYGAVRDTAVFLMTVQAAPVPPDITVVGTPASVTVLPGASATYTLAFTRNEGTIGLGSFSQTVSGLPSGATATFTPIVPTTTSQLVVATTAATLDGVYPLMVTATLGTLVKAAMVTLLVATPPNFTMALSPTAITVNRGASADVVATLLRTGPAGPITIDAQSIPAGVTVTPSPAVVNALSTSSRLAIAVSAAAVPGTYAMTVRGVSGVITRTQALTLTIPAPPPSDVTITVLTPSNTVASGGTTQIPIKLTRTAATIGALLELRSAGVPAGGHAWITPSITSGDNAMLNVIGGIAGTYTVAVSIARGAFPPTDVATINVTPTTAGDFSLLPAPQTLDVPTGASTGAAIQIGRTNGFTGAVSFVAIADKPTDHSVTFSLNSTTGSGMGMTIFVSPNAALGPQVMRIRGTSGSLVHEVSMTLNVTSASTPYPYPYSSGVKPPPPPQ